MNRRALTAMLLMPVVLLACGDDDDKAVTTDAPATDPVETDAPTTTAAATTTEAPTTTAAATTTTEAVPEGWTVVDPVTIDAPLAVPCCASNWEVDESPALPEPGGTLEDGVYRVVFTWPEDLSAPIDASVQRFVPCAEASEFSCDADNADGTFAPESMGVDESESFQYELHLDDELEVVLGGFNGFDNASDNFATGTGTDLAELLTAVDEAYATVFADRLAAGEDPFALMQEIAAAPTNGFEPASEYGDLKFVANGAPGLLFQTLVYRDDPTTARGSDVVHPISLVIEDGQPKLIVYAGFYS